MGVKFQLILPDTIHMSQPLLIITIFKELKLIYDSKHTKNSRTPQTKIYHWKQEKYLKKHEKSSTFDNSFHYRKLIGMMNYLEGCSRLDISYVVHQWEIHCESHKIEHGQDVIWIERYILGNIDKESSLN